MKFNLNGWVFGKLIKKGSYWYIYHDNKAIPALSNRKLYTDMIKSNINLAKSYLWSVFPKMGNDGYINYLVIKEIEVHQQPGSDQQFITPFHFFIRGRIQYIAKGKLKVAVNHDYQHLQVSESVILDIRQFELDRILEDYKIGDYVDIEATLIRKRLMVNQLALTFDNGIKNGSVMDVLIHNHPKVIPFGRHQSQFWARCYNRKLSVIISNDAIQSFGHIYPSSPAIAQGNLSLINGVASMFNTQLYRLKKNKEEEHLIPLL